MSASTRTLTALAFRRYAVIGAPILAALLMVSGFFLDPAIDKSGREMAAEYAAHPEREQVSALAFHFAFALLAVPAVALIVAVRAEAHGGPTLPRSPDSWA